MHEAYLDHEIVAARAWGDAQGYAWASANLAELYYFGVKGAADHDRALAPAQRAAAGGNRKGLWLEGMIEVAKGKAGDNLVEARHGYFALDAFLQQPAWDEADEFNPARGYMEATARYILAAALHGGSVLRRDAARAQSLAREAADLGHPGAAELLREISALPR